MIPAYMTATGNQPGTYTWSNGMSGTTINVDHGGAYRVRFQPEGADCEAIAYFTAPKSPDEFTWIFPTGCFEFCQSHYPPVIIGPLPPFTGGYAYEINNNNLMNGTGVVPELPLIGVQQGALDLSLDNGYCSTTTGVLDFAELTNCEPCQDVEVKPSKFIPMDDGTGFIYYQVSDGGLFNPYGIPITITLSSPDGTFSPAAFTLPPVSGIQFGIDPIDFIPFNPIVGNITVEYDVTGNAGNGITILCQGFLSINILGQRPMNGISEGGGDRGLSGISAQERSTKADPYGLTMTVMPNPATTGASVRYLVENIPDYESGIIRMYSLNGTLVGSQKVMGSTGLARFDLNGLATGTYVLVFFNQGQRMAQQVIIKE